MFDPSAPASTDFESGRLPLDKPVPSHTEGGETVGVVPKLRNLNLQIAHFGSVQSGLRAVFGCKIQALA